jgi:hypothetical protein
VMRLVAMLASVGALSNTADQVPMFL